MAEDISPLMIERDLPASIIGRKVFYYPTLVSTMDTARLEAKKGVTEGTVIITDEQTGGRGRLHRSWLSPSGNIALSIILHPELAWLPYLIMITSLAAAHGIEFVTDLKTQIKWPNDILVDGKKVCGILIENQIKKSRVAFSIVGIGINTDLNVGEYPDIAIRAASLVSKNDKANLRLEIIRSLLTEFDKLYLTLPDGRSIYEAWRERLITLGKHVKATSVSQVIEGVAESVDESGALLILQSDGTLVKVFSGDVTLQDK